MKYENIVNLALNSVDDISKDAIIFLTENQDEVGDYKSWVRMFEEYEDNPGVLITLLIKTKILVEKEGTFGMYQVSENLVFKTQMLKEIVALYEFLKLYRESNPEEWAEYLGEED